jgi:hypothetical protein
VDDGVGAGKVRLVAGRVPRHVLAHRAGSAAEADDVGACGRGGAGDQRTAEAAGAGDGDPHLGERRRLWRRHRGRPAAITSEAQPGSAASRLPITT